MNGHLPRVPTFQQYSTLLTEDGNFKRAVEICELAISFGLRDGTTGIKSPIPDIDSNLPVKIRQCVVDVDLPRSIKYSGRAKSWVIAHLQMAMVQPKMINETIYCCEPDAWGAA